MLKLTTTVLILLAAFSIIGLVSGCASRPAIPERPIIAVCVADEYGGAMCHDPRTGGLKPKLERLTGFVCFEPEDYRTDEEWIRQLMESANGF